MKRLYGIKTKKCAITLYDLDYYNQYIDFKSHFISYSITYVIYETCFTSIKDSPNTIKIDEHLYDT